MLLAIAAGHAQSVLVTTNYYEVSGTTQRELRQSINRSRPWRDKEQTDAQTQWKVDWTYRSVPTETGCRIQSFQTTVSIVLTLPKWVSTENTSKELVLKWEKYLQALKQHEDGHTRIVLAAAAEVRKRAQALKEEPTCEKLSQSAAAAANKVIEEFRAKDIQYDVKTAHGATQGAHFP